jgi:hypothetical protein
MWWLLFVVGGAVVGLLLALFDYSDLFEIIVYILVGAVIGALIYGVILFILAFWMWILAVIITLIVFGVLFGSSKTSVHETEKTESYTDSHIQRYETPKTIPKSSAPVKNKPKGVGAQKMDITSENEFNNYQKSLKDIDSKRHARIKCKHSSCNKIFTTEEEMNEHYKDVHEIKKQKRSHTTYSTDHLAYQSIGDKYPSYRERQMWK